MDVDQFYGIEYEEFPARIAEVAMYLMDHLANQELSQQFGLSYARIPLHTPANIHVGNAVRIDWSDILSADQCSYLLGNPPFVAKKRRNAEQIEDMEGVFGGRTVIDYVGAWFVKATAYTRGHATRVAFVATNSLVQGEQVPALWPRLLADGMRIDFAHRSFRWTSEARGRAAVYVVIIGFSEGGKRATKLIYDYERPTVDEPQERVADQINPYLADAPAQVIPQSRRTPLLPVPAASWGSMPNDGGHLLLTDDEKQTVESSDQRAARYIRPLLGAEQIMTGTPRWCFWLAVADPRDIRGSRVLRDRISAVKAYRELSKRPATRQLATVPALFGEIRQPTTRYLCAPLHTSERRQYIPMVFADPEVIAHNSTFTIQGADMYLFGLLHSAMWMTWVRAIGGRLESRYRISAGGVYNTFPWPDPPAGAARKRVINAAKAVLDARDAHQQSVLADLYDPLAMPSNLVRAHAALDRHTDALYGRGSFDEVKRLAALLRRYHKLTRLTAPGQRRLTGLLTSRATTRSKTASQSGCQPRCWRRSSIRGVSVRWSRPSVRPTSRTVTIGFSLPTMSGCCKRAGVRLRGGRGARCLALSVRSCGLTWTGRAGSRGMSSVERSGRWNRRRSAMTSSSRSDSESSLRLARRRGSKGRPR